MAGNLTIVRRIVHPSEHSRRTFRWVYEYDLRESTTVRQRGLLFSIFCPIITRRWLSWSDTPPPPAKTGIWIWTYRQILEIVAVPHGNPVTYYFHGIAAVGAGADTKSNGRARRHDEVESIKSCLRAYR
jgi:hypothetical protein